MDINVTLDLCEYVCAHFHCQNKRKVEEKMRQIH
uniref:CATA3 n=1 Tax=Arundo donax TaxID=35708 RepID=A0A0A9HGD0_ARUDO